MLAWASSKATSLLLVALLLVGGFAVLTDFRLKLTQKDLVLQTELLAVEKDKYKAIEGSYTKYREDVQAGKEELAKVLEAIEDNKRATTNAINKIRLYPPSPVLDSPFPPDYLRLLRTGSTVLPPAPASSSDHK